MGCNDDFEMQTDKLMEMFTEKGYQLDFLKTEKDKVRSIEREQLLADKEVSDSSNDQIATFIVLDYNLQNREVEKSISKYWGYWSRIYT